MSGLASSNTLPYTGYPGQEVRADLSSNRNPTKLHSTYGYYIVGSLRKGQMFYKHQRRDKGNPNTSSHIEHSRVKVGYPDAGIPTGQGPGWETNGARVLQHGSRLMLGQWMAPVCCASIRSAMVGIYPCIYVKLFILEWVVGGSFHSILWLVVLEVGDFVERIRVMIRSWWWSTSMKMRVTTVFMNRQGCWAVSHSANDKAAL